MARRDSRRLRDRAARPDPDRTAPGPADAARLGRAADRRRRRRARRMGVRPCVLRVLRSRRRADHPAGPLRAATLARAPRRASGATVWLGCGRRRARPAALRRGHDEVGGGRSGGARAAGARITGPTSESSRHRTARPGGLRGAVREGVHHRGRACVVGRALDGMRVRGPAGAAHLLLAEGAQIQPAVALLAALATPGATAYGLSILRARRRAMALRLVA